MPDQHQEQRLTIAVTPVTSNRIAGIGYDAATQTLAVQFPPNRSSAAGAVYHYAGVSPEFFAEFQAAESKGKFFEARVRGAFEYERQPEPEKEGSEGEAA